jgi:hypothetical protein
VCESIVRVVYSLEADIPTRPDFIVTNELALCGFAVATLVRRVETTRNGKSESCKLFPCLSRWGGKSLAQEDGRTLPPVEVNGEKDTTFERQHVGTRKLSMGSASIRRGVELPG